MNREWIEMALGQLDEELIAGALSLRGGPSERGKHMTHRSGKSSRRLAVLALAACLLLALSVTAYAANLWGIREMFRTDTAQLPEAAEEYIEPHNETAQGEGWSARITEAYCDAGSALVTVTVSGGDRYLLAPADAAPEEPLWVIGREGEGTLGAYAEAQGKTLLLVGASLPFDALDITRQGQRAENLSDSEMSILIDADKGVSARNIDTVCTVYAREADSEEVQRLEIPFTMTEGLSRELGVFAPQNPDAVSCLQVGDAVLTETPLGVSVYIPMTVTDEEAFRAFMKLEFEELQTRSGSFGEGGARYDQCRGSVGDTLTVRFYGWGKEPLGELVFRKK